MVAQSRRLLLISPFDEDHRRLSEILQHADWRPRAAHTRAEALAYLRDNPAGVAICEADLPDGTCEDVLSSFAQLRCPPYLIVCSRLADESFWAEVLNLGGQDVLAKPLDAKELTHVLDIASLVWKAPPVKGCFQVQTA